MSDVQSNVKPLTLTTGRVIFAIAGVYVTQSLVSALSMQSLPALVRAAGGSLALAGATTLFMLPWALKFIWAPWIERWRLPPGSPERRSRMLILRGQVALAAILTIALVRARRGISRYANRRVICSVYGGRYGRLHH